MFLYSIDFDTLLLISVTLVCVALVTDLIHLIRTIRKGRVVQVASGKVVISKVSKDGERLALPELSIEQAEKQPAQVAENVAGNSLLVRIWGFRLFIFNALIAVIVTFVVATALAPLPGIIRTYPASESNWQDYAKPVELDFNIPVRIDTLKPNISIDGIKGTWVFERYLGFLPVTRVAKFYPDESLPPEQRMVIYITGMARVGVNEDNEGGVNFYTQKEPEVNSTFPLNQSSDVDVNTSIIFRLTAPNQPYDQWSFESDPQFDYQMETPDTQTFILKPTNKLEQGRTYTISVFRTPVIYNIGSGAVVSAGEKQLVHQLVFTTVKAPLIKKFTPTGTGIMQNEAIKVIFDLPMQRQSVESGISINPPVVGKFSWGDDQTLTFTPDAPLPKETDYSVTFAAGIRSTGGGVTEAPVVYNFSTIGAVKVSSMKPDNGATRVTRTTLSVTVTFDQEVDHSSAESHFSITPGVPGVFSWNGNIMTFQPTIALAFSTQYVAKISPGVVSVYGLDGRDISSTTFTTVSNVTLIPGFVWDHQDYTFSCAVASAKMMLNWKGISVSEDTIISRLGEDNGNYVWDSGKNAYTWGNPHRNYLGNPNGSGYLPQEYVYPGAFSDRAYGVLWDPILNLYTGYGVKTILYSGWSISGLVEEILAGHPVQIWWFNGVSSGATISWYDNITGQKITTISGMHSVDVVGFNGDPDNPTSFIIEDPWFGYKAYSTSTLIWQWGYFGNTGIAIY